MHPETVQPELLTNIRICESPRDAFQSIHNFIPTEIKAVYINLILQVGFDVVDFGSIVSPKAIPQMADTVDVLKRLHSAKSESQLMVLVPNVKGGEIANQFDQIDVVSYPFSISPSFLSKNIGKSLEESFADVLKIKELCDNSAKKFLPYITMGFGNPYLDDWSLEILFHWIKMLENEGIREVSLSDIVGVADSERISQVYQVLFKEFPAINFGLHLHSKIEEQHRKLDAAFSAGVRSFDSVINGIGGCPMTGYDLLGNLNTLKLIEFLEERRQKIKLDVEALRRASDYMSEIISKYL